jgi:hypothetical protein
MRRFTLEGAVARTQVVCKSNKKQLITQEIDGQKFLFGILCLNPLS